MPRAAIAFGSNLGDRATNIAQALRSIGRFCTVQRTSSLYESPPAYVTEQPPFLNSVCHVETSLAPRELLAAIKGVERELGRQDPPPLRFGPREIDLDRAFVLRDTFASVDAVKAQNAPGPPPENAPAAPALQQIRPAMHASATPRPIRGPALRARGVFHTRTTALRGKGAKSIRAPSAGGNPTSLPEWMGRPRRPARTSRAQSLPMSAQSQRAPQLARRSTAVGT